MGKDKTAIQAPYRSALEGERDLLLRLKQGDHTSFDRLYYHYEPRLRLFLYPFIGTDPALLDSMIQDAFVKVWQKREDLAGIEFFEFYLQRIGKNLLLDHWKLRAIRDRHEATLARHQPFTDDSTRDQLQLKEYMQIAQEAIARLPERRRAIFTLNVLEGFSLDEVAEALQVSKDVVKKQLVLAKSFIREYIGREGDLKQVAGLVVLLELLP